LWHCIKGKRVIPFLFGDGHAENWQLPPSCEKAGNAPAEIGSRFW
jgi:prepilin-type processing-associated H-X9-DG protein